MKLCLCGCGEEIPIETKYGRHINFKHGHRLKSYRIKWGEGYIKILKPFHIFADKKGYVLEHRFVYEQFFNCCLLHSTHIHHKNGITNDNRIENLEAMSKSKHSSIHMTIKNTNRKMGSGWNKGIKTGIIPKTAFSKKHKPWNKGKKIGSSIALKAWDTKRNKIK